MQTDIVEKAGINPKTLPSSLIYWQKLERRISYVLALPFLALILVATLDKNTDSLAVQPSWEAWVIWLGFASLLIGAFYGTWATYLVPKIYAWRVRTFAKKNNLHLLPQSKLVGLIPDTVRHADVHGVHAQGCTLPVSGQQITVFDYSCAIGYGKHEEHITKGLAVLQLRGDYPHLFIDSKKNGKNHQYAARQRVKLEGNFSKYFDIYMPEGSAAGSLTVFAPDMMQTILDSGKLFDVEINGNEAVIISDELAFTRRVLPSMLNCAAGMSKEFKELDRTWEPVFTPNGTKFTLKGQPLWRLLLISLLPMFIGLSFNLLPEKFKHPIKNQPAPVLAPQDSNIYGRDADTLAAAYQIADQLNAYTAKNPVPDSLTQANIINPLGNISYKKFSSSIYQFCAYYNYYINGNGPTGASGNIVEYYGATVDSPNLPSTLQIVEWHEAGKNCQIIKPFPPVAE